MTTLKDQFNLASEHFTPIYEQFSDKIKLKMYGLYNQATKGDVSGSAPKRLDVVKYAKYAAWKKCSGMPKELAMKRYIAELRALDPTFSLPSDKLQQTSKKTSEKSKGSPSKQTLVEAFNKTAYFVRHTNRFKAFKKQRVLLYAYYKQATDGVCTRPQPSVFAGRETYARWRAWGNLFDMTKEEAMQKYIEQVRKVVPEFDGGEESVHRLLESQRALGVKSTLFQGDANGDIDDDQLAEMLGNTSPKVLASTIAAAMKENKQIAFITGATGFIGKHLVDKLLNKKQYYYEQNSSSSAGRRGVAGNYGRYLDFVTYGSKTGGEETSEEDSAVGTLAICFIRPQSKQKMIKQILDRNGKTSIDSIVLLEFSLEKKDYGLKPEILKVLQASNLTDYNARWFKAEGRDRARLYHLAAKYAFDESEEENKIYNVEGTKHTVELCKKLGLKLEYASSIAVAGDYIGMFLETNFDEGQQFDNSYAETKYLAEKVVRQEAMNKSFRYTIYRPGVVVGHSLTGEADKIDGPYYFFKVLQLLRKYLPEQTVLPFLEGEAMPVVPVDYVVNATVYLATCCDAEATDKKVFQLVDSSAPNQPDTFIDMMNTFARAAHSATFSSRITTVLMSLMPRKLTTAIQEIPILKDAPSWLAKNIFDIPKDLIGYFENRTTYDDSDTQQLLAPSSIRCPSLDTYAPILWDYYERHLDLKNIDPARALLNEVRNKKILITGASDGIGLALAKSLVSCGAHVIIVARNPEKVAKCVSELKEQYLDEKIGGSVKGYIADLAQEKPTNDMIDKVLKENGSLDILVNNAGRSIRRSVEYQWKGTGRFHDFERTIDLNYYGSLRCILGFLPMMRDRKQGHVINISTIGAVTNAPRFSAYVASKAALDAFTRCVSSECAKDNVHFSTVYMPLVKTKMIVSKGNNYEKSGPNILSVEEACGLIHEAMLEKHRTVATETGRIVSLLYFIAPSAVESVLNIMYRLEPESAPKGQEQSAKAKGDKEQLKAILSIFKGAV